MTYFQYKKKLTDTENKVTVTKVETRWGEGQSMLGLTFAHSYVSSQGALVVKNPPANAGDIRDEGWIAGSGRSPEGRVTHSSILVWRIRWREEPCGLQSMGWQRVGHD